MTSFFIPVGRDRIGEEVAPVRSLPQREAVAAIVAAGDFSHALNNPFTEEVGGRRGPFRFSWYDTAGVLHAVRIGVDGKVLGTFSS